MVKIKKIFIGLLTLSTVLNLSCNFYKRLYKRNSCKNIRAKVNFHLEAVDEKFYSVCDTSNVYIYIGDNFYMEDNIYIGDKGNKNLVNNYGLKNFLKFYGNGKVGFFNYEDGFSKKVMNPCRASYAFYGYKKNKLLIKRFVVTETHGEYRFSYSLTFKGDTLELVDKEGMKTVYLKKKIPQEWLIYKPDW